jgi:hypothetical protein
VFYCIHSETGYDQFGPVFCGFLQFRSSSWILKLSGTGPVCGPSKKGNGTGTGPDFKALFAKRLTLPNSESKQIKVNPSIGLCHFSTLNGPGIYLDAS